MLTVIICIIVGGIIGGLCMGDFGERYVGWGLLFGFLTGLLIILVLGIVLPQESYFKERFDLVALKDNVNSGGSFFLGGGSIEGELKYFFYKKEGGAFRGDSIDVDTARIFEDEENNPYIDKYGLKFKNSFWSIWTFPCGNCDRDRMKHEVHIPKGSILQGYRLDLE